MGLTPQQVLQLYRLDMQTILHLVNDLLPDLTPNIHTPTSIPPLIKVTAVLQFLATGSYQHTTGSVHGLAQPTFSRILTQVLNALYARVHQHIRMPRGVAAITAAKTAFYAISRFPNVIGCIDCTHVPLVPPSAHREAYRNRKGQLTMNIQMVSDAHMCITNLCARYPGSCHDARILRASRLFDVMEDMPHHTWLLGDSGYPLMSWLMTPLRQPQTRGERRYNRAHIRTRNIVERAFGLLKGRFRCLHRTGGALMYRPQKVALIICACVILHNICIRRNVPMPDGDQDSSDSDDDQDGGDGVPVPRRLPQGYAHDIRQRLVRNVFA